MQQVLLDVWGVLHDGRRPYPDAVRFLERARRAGVRVDIVTNASWTRERVVAGLRAFGFDLAGVADVWTAGTIAREIVRERAPRRVAYEGREVGAWLVEGFDVVDVARAELLVFADPTPASVAVLGRALEAGVPVLCANPDMFIEDRHGARTEKAGRLAAAHEAAGGTVLRAGKPDPRIFRRAAVSDRAVMIGDGALTDLAGAHAAGLPAVWVCRRPGPDFDAVVARWRPAAVVRDLDGIPSSALGLSGDCNNG
ncbi:MAG: HAD hydrolase-like protein [Myxococcales bacterium]|nr:HAD hydrolase-like protein [Myxococcales bacterium]